MKETHRYISAIGFLLYSLFLSGCVLTLAAREIIYRPSPNDPYHLWRAYITDSGLLYLCSSVDNGLEGMDRVERVYNLELRLEETLDPQHADKVQVVQVDDHPSLKMTKGYLSDLCQFDDKRATKKANETGWIEISMDKWDQGFVEVQHSDIEAGTLPVPPAEPRVVLYDVQSTDPPEYLLMGQLIEGGMSWKVLLVLGSEHIDTMW